MALMIDGLENLHLVGEGGFGKVYRAWQRDFGRDVAVKVLTAASLDERSARRFERERQALGRLSGHPHIVTVYDHGVMADSSPYLVMEFAAGGSVADLIAAEGPMLWPAAVGYGVQICSALHAAHEAGVLHRDIKPENILLTGSGRPKLADFGIARLSDRTVTQTTSVTASVLHAAPELLDGADPSVATDLYAFGSTLFTMLAGHPPFHDGRDATMPALLMRIMMQPAPDLRQMGVPSSVADVITALLAKDPAARPPSTEVTGAMLKSAQVSSGMPATTVVGLAGIPPDEASEWRPAAPTEGSDGQPAARQGSRSAVMVVGAVALLALLVGGAAAVMSLRSTPDVTASPPPPVVAGNTTATASTSPAEAPPPAAEPTRTPTPVSIPAPNLAATPEPPAPVPVIPSRPVFPTGASASGHASEGFDAAGITTTFVPANTIDGATSTAWRVAGTGVGHTLTFTFSEPVEVDEVAFVTGYDKIDNTDGVDRWPQNRRVLSVRVTAGDGSSAVVQLSDTRSRQTVSTPGLGPSPTLTVEVLSSSSHGGRDYAAISELAFTGRPG